MQLVRTLIVACIAYGKNRCAMRAQSDFIMAIGKLLQITVQAYQNCFHYGTFDRIMLNYISSKTTSRPKRSRMHYFAFFLNSASGTPDPLRDGGGRAPLSSHQLP